MVHQRAHSQQKTTATISPFVGPWKCNVCGEKFVNPKDHVDHMRSHSLEYPSSCPLCLSRFQIASDLANHDCPATKKSRIGGSTSVCPPSAISETPKPKQSQRNLIPPITTSPVVTLSSGVHENLTVPPPRTSPSFEECLDEEAIFEAAQNPILRSRSSSFEANNNRFDSVKDFLVEDPWQASSALFNNIHSPNENNDKEDNMAVSGEQEAACERETIVPPSQQQSIDEIIEDLIQPGISLIPQRTRERNRSRNPIRNRFHQTRQPILKRQSKTATVTEPPSNHNSSSNPSSMSENLPPESTITQPHAKSAPKTIPATVTRPVSLRTQSLSQDASAVGKESGRGCKSLNLRRASQNDAQENRSSDRISNSNSKSGATPLQKNEFKCFRCKIDFPNANRWGDHLSREHLDVSPKVRLDRLDFVPHFNHSETSYVVTTHRNGFLSISVKRKRDDANNNTRDIRETSVGNESCKKNNEQRKEPVKITLCRNANQYVVKRNSTEIDAELNISQNESETSETITESEPESVLPDLPEKQASERGDKVGSADVTAEGRQKNNHVIGNSKVGFRPRFMGAVRTIMLQNKKKDPTAKPDEQRVPTSTAAAPAQAGDKSSMTSSTTSNQNSTSPVSSSKDGVDKSNHSNTTASSTTSVHTSPNEMPTSRRNDSSVVTPLRDALNKTSSKEGCPSPTIIADLRRSNGADKVVVKREPTTNTTTQSVNNSTSSAQAITENAILPDDGARTSEPVNEQESDMACDDEEGALIIDLQEDAVTETENQSRSSPLEERISEKDTQESLEKNRDGLNAGNGDNTRKDSCTEDVDDDLKCRVCGQVFSNDDDLDRHFSSEHFRTVEAASILETEPESPFPTVTVHGRSDIFEDEVEESEPFPVETELVELPMTSQLSDLLRRDSGEDDGRVMDSGATIPNYPIQRPPHQQQYGAMRPPLIGRGMPNIRPGMQMMHTEYGLRMGMTSTNPMLIRGGPPGPRLYRPNGYPTTLHQALVNRQSMPDQMTTPPRPQLRPMPAPLGRAIPGPPPQLQTRPPLTRGLSQPPQQTPQSILRTTSPLSQQHLDHSNQLQVQQLQQTITQLQNQMTQVTNRLGIETSELIIARLRIEYDKLLERHGIFHRQLQTLQQQQQAQQQQAQQQQLQRQQLQQQQIQQQQLQLQRQQFQQHQHQQQLRQQLQLQQQQQQQQQQMYRNSLQENHSIVNSSGKRPSVELVDAAHAKQARMENMPPQNSPGQQTNDNLSVRIPQGVTLSVVHQPFNPNVSPSPPATAQTVGVGMHSGGSTGSRHSSGTVSPAGPSPGAVTTRLGNSGITLTPASPLAVSPPENPIHSPISEGSQSPRGSPRIPASTVIQRVPTASIVSPSSSTGTQQESGTFAMPRAPPTLRISGGGSSNGIVTNVNAERPDRPPTIDLTDDEVQAHNMQMRATGGGATTQDQIRLHEARRGVSGIPGTSQFSIRPSHAQPVQQQIQQQTGRPIQCPQCPALFTSVELMADHRQKIHGVSGSQMSGTPPSQIQTAHPHPYMRQPPPMAVRRPSPPSNMPNISNPQLRMEASSINHNRGPVAPMLRPPVPSQLSQIRSTQSRPQENVHRSQSSDEPDKFVIPLLNLSRIDQNKLKALNEIGVASFIPLQGITRLGIPIMRLLPGTSLGHFPHDTAIEIGPVQIFPDSHSTTGNPNPSGVGVTNSGPVPRPAIRTSPSHNVPNHGAVPPHHLHPPSVVSPPMGTICTDRNCPDLIMRRPSPSSVVHHMGIHNHNIPAGVATFHSSNNINSNHNQIQHHQSIQHDTYLSTDRRHVMSNDGQLVVTPVQRN